MEPATLLTLMLGVAPLTEAAPAVTTPPAAAAPAIRPGDDGSPTDPLYDGGPGSNVEAAYRAAEGEQGPLDGRWRVRDRDGTPLYDFMFADPGGAPSAHASDPDHPAIEGAWRDLKRLGNSGVLDSVRQDGGRLVIRFTPSGQAMARTLILHPIAGGGWAGDLSQDGGQTLVFLDRP